MNKFALLLALVVPLATAAEPTSPSAPTASSTATASTDVPTAKELPAVDALPYEDTAARRLYPPRYPAAALRVCAYGVVKLRVLIDAKGKVLGVKVEHSAGHPALDEAAVQAAVHWRFNPGYQDGKPVGGDVMVPVHFQNPC